MSPSAALNPRRLPLFADLVLVLKGVKKGAVVLAENGALERLLRMAERETGEDLFALGYAKDPGRHGVYHIYREASHWLVSQLKGVEEHRAGSDRAVHRMLGGFRGFPPCCVAAYCRAPRPLDRFLTQPGAPAFHIARLVDQNYEQRSVVSWVPCSPRCKATWDYIGRARRILSRYEAFRRLPLPDHRTALGSWQ